MSKQRRTQEKIINKKEEGKTTELEKRGEGRGSGAMVVMVAAAAATEGVK